MGKIVILAEKPSVGKSIAKVIGCRTNEDGYCYNDKYIVTWAVGHLVTLQEPDEIDVKYKKWSMEHLPIMPGTIPLKTIANTKSQFNVVKKLLNDKDTDSVICATDAGREGELIFRYIYEMAGCKKTFSRLWISSMTDEAIREGMRNIRPGTQYDALYRSAKCRSEADWIVGMNASRAFTLRYDALLSVGRVQTPTLAFLVRRHNEIENFIAKSYSTFTADFGDYKGIFFSEKLEPDTHIEKHEQAEALAKIVKGQPAMVVSAETQRKKEQPPQLYDLTTLQRDANKKYGYTADKTLKLAQALYEEHKAITYPRTDSRYLPQDMVPIVVSTMKKLPEKYQELISGALNPDDTINTSKRVVDGDKVSDHHAIIPTNQTADLDKMTDDERKLFDLITKRMLAAFYPNHEFDATKIITKVGRHNFRTTGKTVIINGWRDVNEIDQPEKEEDKEQKLPILKYGDTRKVENTIIKDETTKPPAQYNDASLLLAMETAGKDSEDEEIIAQMKGHGIGTPATRAAIIERIISVGYAQRKGKQIIPTAKGIALIGIMPDQISSAEMTGRWELALDKIANGRQEVTPFMESISRFTNFIVEYAKTNDKQFDESAFDDGTRKHIQVQTINEAKCPLCGEGDLVEMEKGFGCSRYKEGCGFTVWKQPFRGAKIGDTDLAGITVTKDMLLSLLNGGVETVADGTIELDEKELSFKAKNGLSGGVGEYDMTTSIDRTGLKCPLCGKKNTVTESARAFSCSACKKFVVWKDVFVANEGKGPKTITRNMMKNLIEDGKYYVIDKDVQELGHIEMDNESISYFIEDNEEAERTKSIEYNGKTTSNKRSSTKGGKKEKQSKLDGLLCPICGKGRIRENEKAFGCTGWKDGCDFTIWKNCLDRVDGPKLTDMLVAKLIDKKKLMISGATIKMDDKGMILYYKAGTSLRGKADGVAFTTKKK